MSSVTREGLRPAQTRENHDQTMCTSRPRPPPRTRPRTPMILALMPPTPPPPLLRSPRSASLPRELISWSNRPLRVVLPPVLYHGMLYSCVLSRCVALCRLPLFLCRSPCPIRRVWGIQELFASLFSAGNGLPHLYHVLFSKGEKKAIESESEGFYVSSVGVGFPGTNVPSPDAVNDN